MSPNFNATPGVILRILNSVTICMVSLLMVVSSAQAQLFETRAKQAYLIDADTQTVLFSKDPDTPIPPASLAKLMTMEVVFNAIKAGRLTLDSEFYVSENAWRTAASSISRLSPFSMVCRRASPR